MLLSVSEVAKLLKVNRNFVYKLIKDGELEAVKIGSIKVKREALNRYVENNISVPSILIPDGLGFSTRTPSSSSTISTSTSPILR